MLVTSTSSAETATRRSIPAGRAKWIKIKNPAYSQAEGRDELFNPPRASHRQLARYGMPMPLFKKFQKGTVGLGAPTCTS